MKKDGQLQTKSVALTESSYRKLRAIAGQECVTTGRAVDVLIAFYESRKDSTKAEDPSSDV